MKQKRLLSLVAISILIAVLVALPLAGICADQTSGPIKFRLAHGRATNHITGRAVEKFKEFVQTASSGRLQIDIFPDAQLYDDQKAPGAIAGDYIQMACTSNVVLTGWVPGWDILSMPFLFKSDQQFNEFTKTDAWQRLLRDTEAKKLKVVSFWPGGSVFFWNRTKQINSIGDFRGIKTRVLESPIHKDIIGGVGANPIVISGPEVYTALQQGMIDGVFTTVDTHYTLKWFEYTKYGLVNPILMVGTGILISQRAWTALPPDLQKVIMEQGRKTSDWETPEITKQTNEFLKTIEAKGVSLNELSPSAFMEVRKVVDPILEKYSDKVGRDLINAAKAMK